MPIKDVYNKLKTTVLGTKTADIDGRLDQAVKDITAYRSQTGRNSHIELLRHLISKTQGFSIDSQGGLFNQGALSPATFGQGKRILRYKTYESIVYNISYMHRALMVLTDNILSPDDITKVSLEIKPISFMEDEVDTESRTKNIEETAKRLKLEEHMNIIVRNTLLYGDYFCEIADTKTALTSKALLSEDLMTERMSHMDIENIVVEGNLPRDTKNFKVVMDYSSHIEDEKKDGQKKIDEVHLVFHEPKKVLKLQSEIFPLCFGYLIFPNYTLSPQDVFQDQAVNSICASILKSLQAKVPQIKDIGNTDELKGIIGAMIKESDYSRTLNIRYVPPDKIQHFMHPSTKYYPYGESIFDSCQFNAKVLIALETALAIQRLARSTEKRKIAVEVGLPRDARKIVEKLKEELRKRKVSLDSFGTVDTIPSTITTFEDIYIPQKDGKPFVDISTFTEGNVDVRGKVDELKFIRDSLVACLGVPASFLNIEENLCSALYNTIKLCDGRTPTLQEIIDEFENGKELFVYSYDPEKETIFPNKIIWAGKTRLNTKLVRVHLDNGETIDVTPDHPFMLKDGSYVEAQYLDETMELMEMENESE